LNLFTFNLHNENKVNEFEKEKAKENKDDLNNPQQQKLTEQKEKYRGTLIKILHCLSSNTIQNALESFCYDESNSCFYLLSVSILSISL